MRKDAMMEQYEFPVECVLARLLLRYPVVTRRAVEAACAEVMARVPEVCVRADFRALARAMRRYPARWRWNEHDCIRRGYAMVERQVRDTFDQWMASHVRDAVVGVLDGFAP